MNNAVTIAAHEFRTVYRRRMFQILTVAFPVVALIAVGVIWFIQNQDEDDESVKYGYVDMVGMFDKSLTQGKVQFVPYSTFDAGRSDLLEDEIKKLFVIPGNYIETGVVQSFEVGSGLDLDGVDDALTSFLLDNLIGEDDRPELAARLKDPAQGVHVSLDSDGVPREINGPRVVFFLGLAVLLFMSLVTTGGFLLLGLGEEKENRIMEVLLSSVTPAQLLVGKILGLGSAGLSQILVWVVWALVLIRLLPAILPDLDIAPPGVGPTLLALAFFILGYLLFGTLLACLGSITTSAQESQQLQIVVIFPLIIPVYASFYIVSNPTAWITKFLTFFPFTSPLVVLQRLGPEAIEVWEVAVSLGILGLTVLLALFIAARVFRAFLLSYGRRPSAKQLWAALKGG